MCLCYLYINELLYEKIPNTSTKSRCQFRKFRREMMGPPPQTAAPSASAIVHVSAWDEKDSIPVRLATLRFVY